MHVTVISTVHHSYVAAKLHTPWHAHAACLGGKHATQICALNNTQVTAQAHVPDSRQLRAPVTTAAHGLDGAFVLYDAKAQQQQPGRMSACTASR